MHVYLVLRDDEAPAADCLFLEDGFRWRAFLLAPLWLLRHGLWLPLLAYVLCLVAIALLNVGVDGAVLLLVALHALVGLEGQNMRATRLLKEGYRLDGVVTADALEDAEVRYFTDLEALEARATPPAGLVAGPWGGRPAGDQP